MLAAALGLGLLLIGEARHSADPQRTARLLNRAISALGVASETDPTDPNLGLALTEAHILRFQLAGQIQDMLAANIQLDRLSDADAAPREAIAALRAQIRDLKGS